MEDLSPEEIKDLSYLMDDLSPEEIEDLSYIDPDDWGLIDDDEDEFNVEAFADSFGVKKNMRQVPDKINWRKEGF